MFQIDLNSDVGESFGRYELGNDEEVIKRVTSVNIACGFHAGDPCVMDNTIAIAAKYATAVGAHPGLPDLLGFGRRVMAISSQEAKAYITYQIGALLTIASLHGIKIQHVKLHGALYNMAAEDYGLARAIADAVYSIDKNLIFLALANSEMVKAGRDAGLKVANEVFADRAYTAKGLLAPRGTAGAMITDVDICADRIVKMIKHKKVTAITGEEIYVEPHSVCIHGDNPDAVLFINRIKETLDAENIHVTALRDLNI